MIKYIERECLCSNEKAVQSIKIVISKMVRYNNQSLLDWLQSFVQPVNKYIKAMSIDALDDDDAKEVWKDHFVKQTMLSEITQLLLFQKEHLTDHEIRQIKHLSAGDFREKTLQKLITKLSSNFEPYKPDKAILLYLINTPDNSVWKRHLSQIRKISKAALTSQSENSRTIPTRNESTSRTVSTRNASQQTLPNLNRSPHPTPDQNPFRRTMPSHKLQTKRQQRLSPT
jgi:hypothetical protein